ncbi:MAG: MBL fold metallo-hydrolase [Gemmatimonadaceae bacterium]
MRRLLPLPFPLLVVAVAGCASFEAPAYHGPRSDHFDGDRFYNYERVEDRQIADGVRRALASGRRGRWTRWEPVATDVPPARVADGDIRVTFVNHATMLVQMDGLNILTDPVWSDRISPVSWLGPRRHRGPGIRFEDLPPIDVVLLSHNHYDHMDVATLRRLAHTFHPRILAGLGNRRFLVGQGVAGAEDMDWWQSLPVGSAVRITGVPARHWSARSLTDSRRTLWLGFVIEGPSGRVYFAGDTGYGRFLEMIRDRFAPVRLALLPIGPIRPRRAMADRHMSPDDALRAYDLLGAGAAIAMHYGTFQQGVDSADEPADSLRAEVARASRGSLTFWALRNGESRFVPPLDSAATARRPAGPTR